MGIFDIFKRNKAVYDGQALFFKDGQLYKIVGDQNNWYDPRYIVSDGETFDLSNTQQIASIPSPSFDAVSSFGKYGATGMLDYVLRMKAGQCFNRGEKALCSALLWKSSKIMQQNKNAAWKRSDYIRLVTWHYQMGMVEEAQAAREYLEKHVQSDEENFNSIGRKIMETVLENCRKYNMDLIVFHHYASGCCEECDKLSGRVYSISGKSKTFPKLPEYTLKNGNFHNGCRCAASPYFDGKIFYRGKEVDPIRASSRPYEDGRTKREKEAYSIYLDHIQCEKEKEKRTLDFYVLQDLFPDIAPKTLSAYSKMKGSNSPKFVELKEKALMYGIDL